MKIYDIKRWDPIIVKNNTQAYPMVMVEVDSELEKFIAVNAGTAIAVISDSNSIYDGRELPASVYSDGRIIMYAEWYEYPTCLGTVKLLGQEIVKERGVDPYNLPEDVSPAVKDILNPLWEHYDNGKCINNLSSKQINLALIVLFILFLICIK
jgi:hypothetical protein